MFLTILTSIYNRRRFVKRLFRTISNQKSKNFEWIIIDDGSTDGTREVINNQISKFKYNFPIRFLHVSNGGKHRAINKAVKIANGKYFFILDSDDQLVPEATELIEKWCQEIRKLPNFKKFAGVSGLRKTPEGKLLSGNGNGSRFIDASNLERKKYNLIGDMAETYKTSILKKYPFKTFKGENFLSEDVVWNKIAADGYIIRWYMTPIYIGDYLPDGLSKNAVSRDMNNYKGLTYKTRVFLKLEPFREKISSLEYFIFIGRKKNYSFKKISRIINKSRFLLIPQYYLYMIAKKARNKLS